MSEFTERIEQNAEWARTPELAAYRCGKLTNQIQHKVQVLWLLGDDLDVEADEPVFSSESIPWRALSLATRAVLSDERHRYEFEQAVNVAENEWRTRYGALEHHELLRNVNLQIEADRVGLETEDNAPSLATIIENRCRFLLGATYEVVGSLKGFIWSHLDSRNLEFFRLGELVDRLFHPVPAFAELKTQPLETGQFNATPTTSEGHADYDPWGLIDDCAGPEIAESASIHSAPWRLPRQPLPPSLPDEAWWEEFVVRARGCGLAIAQSDCLYTESEASAGTSQREVSQQVDMVEARMFELLEVTPNHHASITDLSDAEISGTNTQAEPNHTQEPDWIPTRVGLDFNLDQHQVRRRDTGAIETPRTAMDFNVLKYIAEKGGIFCSRGDLEENWEQLGGVSNGETSIDSRLHSVRELLRCFGMELENRPRVGWRVVGNNDST